MQLSTNLALSEVTRSETAKRKGISNMPTPEHIENFKKLAEKVFQPIREHFGVPIRISSGYRSEALNKAIGGAGKMVNGKYVPSSQHCTGEAIDIDMDGTSITNKQVFDYIKDNLDFDQLIAEFPVNENPAWVHVSYESTGKQRKQILVAKKVGGATKYITYKSDTDLK
jgi:zinc D-Ala-D-Ala carboxypeptidase